MSRSPSPTSRGGNSMDTFGRPGIRFDDHHFKDKDGKFQISPPKELTKLYHQGPPAKVSIQAEINALKSQTQCCGVYTLQNNLVNNKPVWKHCSEDLVICASQVSGEDGWVVSRFTTAGTSRQQVCMRVAVSDKDAMPFPPKAGMWQEWNGRDWIPAPSVKARPSHHGWGLDKLDRTRLKFSPSSPEGSY